MTRSPNLRPTPRRPWSDEDHARLVALYPDTPTADIARELGRSVRAIYARADAFGLAKSADFYRSQHAGRHNLLRCGVDYRFKPGQRAWNKGLHYQSAGLSVTTQFKPGRPAHEAHNYRPIGSLRINADGILERKVSDDPAIAPTRRWVSVHRLVWEAANGPTPAGHVVVFRTGRHTTEIDAITLDALELVSRQELMRRNTRHRLPKPLADLIALRGAVTRQINKRTTNTQDATP